MGRKTRIDWADSSWNPVTGCLHGCQYCYARRIAERFGLKFAPKLGDPGMEGACKYDTEEAGMDTMLELEKPYVSYDGVSNPYPMAFMPTFHKYRLDEPQNWKKSRTIFVCSMSDLFGEWVPQEWIDQVFKACEEAPWHTYLFLTKNPKRLQKMYAEHTLPEHDNWWWGSTVTDQNCRRFQGGLEHTFISIEPIMGPLDAGLGSFGSAEWIIVGAETANRKDKVVPQKAWIDNITEAAKLTKAAVFMKESLRDLMGDDFKQEFPFKEKPTWIRCAAFCPKCGRSLAAEQRLYWPCPCGQRIDWSDKG